MKRSLEVFGLLLIGIWLSGCSTASDPANNDPYEPMNRRIFALDMRIAQNVVVPTASPYVEFVPKPLRHSIHNFLQNLNAPVIFANDVFQGESNRAAQTFGRLVINSTLGLGGLVDVASRVGIPYHSEDFGQTLAIWGVKEGPYLVLPLLGPDSPRDAAGQVVDYFLDPLNDISYKQKIWWNVGRYGFTFIDASPRNAMELKFIERSSIDYYAAVRSLYRHNRMNEIHNVRIEFENLPDF